jgi:intein-encoded DNA endonuclease-like protein
VKGMAQVPDPEKQEGEEVKKKDNITKTKKRKVAPIEIRIKAFHDVRKLRKRGLSITEIREEIYRKYGVWIGTRTISRWLHGVTSPYNGRRIPSLDLLKPSQDLAYVIGVRLGDGNAYVNNTGYIIRLQAKDKEFVEEFGRCLGSVLGRKPIRPFKDTRRTYAVVAASKTLYELLKKPIDLKRIKKDVEHCKKCTAAFLRGLFDSDGSVNKNGYITLYNTDYEVLVYAQRLLRRFGIESTGPWLHVQKGTIMHDPRTGKQYKTNADCYYIYIRTESLPKFYRYVGFTIRRKQKRVEDYLRRKGLLKED